jgi:superfamily I DNA/RNA helicase
LEFRGQVAERKGIVDIVRWLNHRQGVPLGEILVLGRTGVVTAPLVAEFRQAGIQVCDPDVVKTCFSSPEMRKGMSILRLLANREDSLSWWSLLDLEGGVGNTVIDDLVSEAEGRSQRFGSTILLLYKEDGLKTLAGTKAYEVVSSTLKVLDYVKIPDQSRWGEWILNLSREERIPKVPQPVDSYLLEMDNLVDKDISLDGFVGQIQPLSKDLASKKAENYLRVMTITGSKGLTVRACIIAGCESNIIPHPKGERNEECRLLYVGMTRAREYLFLTRALRRTGTTARAGRSGVLAPRTACPFLEHGPFGPVPGDAFVRGL